MTSIDTHTNSPVGADEPTAASNHAAASNENHAPGGTRRPGRPLEMSADEVLQTIRQRAAVEEGLFRVHLTAPALYARARRLFGAWSAAVREAGVDYEALQGAARARSLQTRRRRSHPARRGRGNR